MLNFNVLSNQLKDWWTHLWLNEGFATWIEYLSVENCLPEWQIWNFYAVDHLMRAFELDSLESSHPIEVTVGHPSEINEIFDSISYCKGSAIIRMLNSYMGSADFVKGLQLYLKKYQYRNAQTNDLWQELDNSSNKPISQIASNWTKMAGYPLIEIVRSFSKNLVKSFIQKHCYLKGGKIYKQSKSYNS